MTTTRDPDVPESGSRPAGWSGRVGPQIAALAGRRLTEREGRIGAGIVTAGALIFYLVHGIYAYTHYLDTSYDLGIFDQAIHAYSHFQAPDVPLKGSGVNVFGDHFHPIIATLAPLYWIVDTPLNLVVAQAVLTALTIPVVYRMAARHAGPTFAVVLSAAFAFGWPLQALIDFDFHEIAFATPLMALALDAADRRDDRRLLLWCALLLLVREDMGILVALLGLMRIWPRPPRWRVVATLVGAGAVMYVVTTSWIIPHFAVDGFAYGGQFGQLGDSLPAALRSIVTRPWHAVSVFFTPAQKTETMGLLVLPFALVCFRSRYSLLILPLLAERMFNVRHNLWVPYFHYNALPWVVLTLAFVDGARLLGIFSAARWARRVRALLVVWLIAFPILLIPYGDNFGVLPLTKLRQGYKHQPAGWAADARRVVEFLPRDVCVAADNRLGPHLTAKDWTTVAAAPTPAPDFYALDMFAPDTGGNPPAPKPVDVYFGALKQGYTVAFESGTFVVLRAPGYRGPSSACAPLGPGRSGPDKPAFPTSGRR